MYSFYFFLNQICKVTFTGGLLYEFAVVSQIVKLLVCKCICFIPSDFRELSKVLLQPPVT